MLDFSHHPPKNVDPPRNYMIYGDWNQIAAAEKVSSKMKALSQIGEINSRLSLPFLSQTERVCICGNIYLSFFSLFFYHHPVVLKKKVPRKQNKKSEKQGRA